jgi:alpha-mannosidase
MRSGRKRFLALLLSCLAPCAGAAAQAQPARDLTKEPTLYVVGSAHLDTQWRWKYPQIRSEQPAVAGGPL